MNVRSGLAERAADAYRALADLAETVEDEWQYVTDLVDAYLPGILALGEEPEPAVTPAQAAAVDEAIAEIALITDPHKAIDWLSTFPHVVGLALGGDVDRPAGAAQSGAGGAAGHTGGAAQSGAGSRAQSSAGGAAQSSAGGAAGHTGGPAADGSSADADDSQFGALRGWR